MILLKDGDLDFGHVLHRRDGWRDLLINIRVGEKKRKGKL